MNTPLMGFTDSSLEPACLPQSDPANVAPPRRVLTFASEVEYLARCMLDCPDRETGGDCFGFWTHTGCPAIQYVIGPGPEARGTATFFTQDRGFLKACGDLLIHEYGLQHIGEWHSHHRLGLARPSGHDSDTVRRAMIGYGLGRFFLIIGTLGDAAPQLNGFLYERGPRPRPDEVEWMLLPGLSPYRERIGGRLDGWNYSPATPPGSVPANRLRLLRSVVAAKPEFKRHHWLNAEVGQQELRFYYDWIRDRCPGAEIRLGRDETVRILFELEDQPAALVYPPDYPAAGFFFVSQDQVVGPPLDFPAFVPPAGAASPLAQAPPLPPQAGPAD
ncbi:MAG: hypothetical protein FJ387_07020 [Verrucomicrobia bacterium]|nr:hypothetical protein [Verrucomicrobiota bacterium]